VDEEPGQARKDKESENDEKRSQQSSVGIVLWNHFRTSWTSPLG
jgi:hypothetical protein